MQSFYNGLAAARATAGTYASSAMEHAQSAKKQVQQKMRERAEQRRQTEEDYYSEEGGRKQSLRANKNSAEEWDHVEND